MASPRTAPGPEARFPAAVTAGEKAGVVRARVRCGGGLKVHAASGDPAGSGCCSVGAPRLGIKVLSDDVIEKCAATRAWAV